MRELERPREPIGHWSRNSQLSSPSSSPALYAGMALVKNPPNLCICQKSCRSALLLHSLSTFKFDTGQVTLSAVVYNCLPRTPWPFAQQIEFKGACAGCFALMLSFVYVHVVSKGYNLQLTTHRSSALHHEAHGDASGISRGVTYLSCRSSSSRRSLHTLASKCAFIWCAISPTLLTRLNIFCSKERVRSLAIGHRFNAFS